MDRRQFLAATGAGAAALSVPASASAQAGAAGAGPGRPVLDITDFGIVAGDSDALAASNSAAAEKLLAYLLANVPTPDLPGTAAIKVTAPAGHFRFARPWVVKCALWLEGQSNSQRFGYATYFDFDKGGFEFHGPGTGHGGVVSPPTTGASGWRLENIACSSRAPAGSGHHGLHAVTRGDAVRCTFNTFPGDGIRIESLTGFGASTNNANSARILFCQCGGNGGSGIALLNGDANCIVTHGCDLHGNGEFGLFDNAFLSNSHIGHHSEGNGLGLVYPGHKMGAVGAVCTHPFSPWARGVAVAVSNPGGTYRMNGGKLYFLMKAGRGGTANAPTHSNAAGVTEADGYKWGYAGTTPYCRYHTVIGQTPAASTTVPGTNPSIWVPFEFANSVSPGMPLWERGMSWKNGGSYCGNSSAGLTVWEACYGEGGQAPAQIRSPQVWVGGQGAVSQWSTCTQVTSFLGGANLNPGGFHAEKRYHNGEPITARFGADLSAGGFLSVIHPTLHPDGFYGAQNTDTTFELGSSGPFVTFAGTLTAFTGGRSTAQPGAVNIPRLFVGSGANARNVDYGSGPPASGHHAAGEIVYNVAPAPGGKVGWVCTAAGTPGTWKAFGAIDS
ncbi:MAG TPA: right-handed parallel beta-helix repeat-containing protein [Allosphingosinicella sp.]|jgi:hypothetical protein|nr:right-handed parallel beta-helix repeat-containing protein [Allosphingosinicella sp.]